MSTRIRPDRGVSLIEALVAMVVLGVGILGVLGMQTTLRQNADLSRQRSEAVRIAQQEVENARAFTSLGTTLDNSGFGDIGTPATATVSPDQQANANTVYGVTRTVPTFTYQGAKTFVVDVAWQDRSGSTESVRLSTNVAPIAPELAGSLGVPGNTGAVSRPFGRNPAIPPGALTQTGGTTSVFTPPNAGSVSWTFNNTSSEITRVCTPTCTDTRLLLLSGFVRFATGNVQPTAANAETPPGTALPVSVQVTMVAPNAGSIVTCFSGATVGDAVAYFCAVPVTSGAPFRYSGRSQVRLGPPNTLSADAASTSFKVCRYTPVQSDIPPGGNFDHPLDYVDVTTPLTGQNFLVVRGAFTCPGNTFLHEPRP